MFGQIFPSFEDHVRPLWATPVWYPCCATLFCLRSIAFSVIIPFVWLNPWAGKMKWIVCCYLRPWRGKMDPSGPLGVSCIVLTRKSSLFGHIINSLLTRQMFVQDGWMLALFSFAFLLTSTSPDFFWGEGGVCTQVNIHLGLYKCKDELGQ